MKKSSKIFLAILFFVLILAVFLVYLFIPKNSPKAINANLSYLISHAESEEVKVGYNFSYGFLDKPTLYRDITQEELENLKILNLDDKQGEQICYKSGHRGCYYLFSNCSVLWNITLTYEVNMGYDNDIFIVHHCGANNLYLEVWRTPSPTIDELIRVYPDKAEEIRSQLNV